MTEQLTPDERAVFHELIAASRVLTVVCNNAATVLSEEFESQITGPMEVVNAVLAKCPSPSMVWDGEFRIEDCDMELFTPDVPAEIRGGRVNTGVRLRHRMTGLGAESYSAPEQEQNKQRAARALKQRVDREARAIRSDPLQ